MDNLLQFNLRINIPNIVQLQALNITQTGPAQQTTDIGELLNTMTDKSQNRALNDLYLLEQKDYILVDLPDEDGLITIDKVDQNNESDDEFYGIQPPMLIRQRGGIFKTFNVDYALG